MTTFGERIRNLRKEKNIPLRILASFLDIDQAILSKIERGLKHASREQVVKLAAYFQTDVHHLLIDWLADKMVVIIREEDVALDALVVAEKKIRYTTKGRVTEKFLIREICQFLRKDGRVSQAWLIGSFARGEAGIGSDVDLMVRYSDQATGTLMDYAELTYNLEKIVQRKVDIVEEGYVKPYALSSINRDKILIYG